MTEAEDVVPRRNRLALETSPYLLQHADNPVDWYPWGDEAFERARVEDKPLLLSVGYSACHWCHVMAHESFEDDSIAALMNSAFVNVKVDREERPDVDSVYMTATQALTGQGGWPMTVFLTPAGRPFYAGTYFPPDDHHGRPSFRRVLTALSDAWANERDKLIESANDITDRLQAATARKVDSGTVSYSYAELTALAVESLREAFDDQHGGFGGAPKFPSPGNLEFLLMHELRVSEQEDVLPSASAMALATLHAMAAGGMYDQLGGGFARYSVDRQWLVPHFEKMLYDNAQLVRAYLHAFQLTGDYEFERIARETLTYLEREMLDDEGGFYSAQDADSEGIEGKFFVWTPSEVASVLGVNDARLFNEVFEVTDDGNFEDPHHPEFGRRNVLSRYRNLSTLANELNVEEGDLSARLPIWREALFRERARRIAPNLDDKVLSSWNGLALAAFAEAGRILGDENYLVIARRNADFLRRKLWRQDRLMHTYKLGVARVEGLLEDYAYCGLGLIELYKATGDLEQLRWAEKIFEVIHSRFYDAESGGFFDTAVDTERLILRQKSFFDAATPSANGAVALLAYWLGRYLNRPEWEELAREIVDQVAEQVPRAASGFGSVLQAMELLAAPRQEIAVVGESDLRVPFERVLAARFLPTVLLAPAAEESGLAVFEGRGPVAGEVTAYICADLTCKLPAKSVEEFVSQLAEIESDLDRIEDRNEESPTE